MLLCGSFCAGYGAFCELLTDGILMPKTGLAHYIRRGRHALAPYVQRLSGKPDLVVLGFNSGANIGDLALTETVEQFCAKEGIRAYRQDLSHLQRWKHFDVPALVAGGGVLHTDVIAQLAGRYRPDRVAIVGADHWSMKGIERHRDWLKRVAFFSSRSERFARAAAEVLGRPGIATHPDLVFGAEWDGEIASDRSDSIGINCLPLYRSQHQCRWETWISKTDPFIQQANAEMRAYDELLAKLAEWARTRSRRVVHIPFTPEDHAFALAILRPLGIECAQYSASPRRTASMIRSCKTVIATRLHAKIFAYGLGVPCIEVNYSQKCIDLCQTLHGSGSGRTSQVDFQHHGESFFRRLVDQPSGVDAGKASELKSQVQEALRQSIAALL